MQFSPFSRGRPYKITEEHYSTKTNKKKKRGISLPNHKRKIKANQMKHSPTHFLRNTKISHVNNNNPREDTKINNLLRLLNRHVAFEGFSSAAV